jgi:hypothetical protein
MASRRAGWLKAGYCSASSHSLLCFSHLLGNRSDCLLLSSDSYFPDARNLLLKPLKLFVQNCTPGTALVNRQCNSERVNFLWGRNLFVGRLWPPPLTLISPPVGSPRFGRSLRFPHAAETASLDGPASAKEHERCLSKMEKSEIRKLGTLQTHRGIRGGGLPRALIISPQASSHQKHHEEVRQASRVRRANRTTSRAATSELVDTSAEYRLLKLRGLFHRNSILEARFFRSSGSISAAREQNPASPPSP